MVAGFVYVGPIALATALYASASREPAALARKVRLTLGLALLAGLLGNAALLVGAERVLGLFGPAYAEQNALGLRLLGLAVFPLIVKDHFVTLYRINGRIPRAAVATASGGLLELSLAVAGGVGDGLAGVSLGYLAALCLEAVVMLRPVYRAATVAGSSSRGQPVTAQMPAERDRERGAERPPGQVGRVSRATGRGRPAT
jgi:O-antigen/teichoic acid export membrane protein